MDTLSTDSDIVHATGFPVWLEELHSRVCEEDPMEGEELRRHVLHARENYNSWADHTENSRYCAGAKAVAHFDVPPKSSPVRSTYFVLPDKRAIEVQKHSGGTDLHVRYGPHGTAHWHAPSQLWIYHDRKRSPLFEYGVVGAFLTPALEAQAIPLDESEGAAIIKSWTTKSGSDFMLRDSVWEAAVFRVLDAMVTPGDEEATSAALASIMEKGKERSIAGETAARILLDMGGGGAVSDLGEKGVVLLNSNGSAVAIHASTGTVTFCSEWPMDFVESASMERFFEEIRAAMTM